MIIAICYYYYYYQLSICSLYYYTSYYNSTTPTTTTLHTKTHLHLLLHYYYRIARGENADKDSDKASMWSALNDVGGAMQDKDSKSSGGSGDGRLKEMSIVDCD